MAAVAIAISAGGALSKFETTALLTVETLEALGRPGSRTRRTIPDRSDTPVFPLGLARQTVAQHLRHFLATIESEDSGPQ